MAKIYISYANVDKEFALSLSQKLIEFGHEITIDSTELHPGIDWRQMLGESLKSADGTIALISKNSLGSQYLFSEIGAARTYIDIEKSKFLIPIILGDIDIPLVLQDIQCLFAKNSTIEELAQQIDSAIKSFYLRQMANREKREKQFEKIESNLSKYVDDAMKELKLRESNNKQAANIWYMFGLICLVTGVLIGVIGINDLVEKTTMEWSLVILLTLKTAVIIGLLIACSKYAFTLGKSYSNESLKHADRSHAISFGKFYLDAYGANAEWSELKEVFQHWNIDKESTFSKLDTSTYDPKFVELIIELSKVVSNAAPKK